MAGLFDLGSCFEEQGQTNVLHDDQDIRKFVQDYVLLVKNISEKPYVPGDKVDTSTKADLRKLYLKSLSIQRKLFFDLVRYPIIPDCINDYRLFPEDSDSFKIVSNKKTLASMWEPYTISAIADFVAFVYGDKDKADFLDGFMTSQVGKQQLCKNGCGDFVPVSQSSFFWYVVRAKIDSEDSWPTKELVGNIIAMLSWSDEYLYADSSNLIDRLRKSGRSINASEVSDLKQHFRKIKLQDLSLGLELFYRKSLAGEKLNLLQRDYWRLWLKEVLSILYATEGVGTQTEMSESQIAEWRNAKSVIESIDYTALFDASSSAALGLVLLPQETGGPSKHDCILAKEVAAYSKDLGFKLAQNSANLHSTVANIERFSEQISEHVDSICQ